jgi:hypothetical protein
MILAVVKIVPLDKNGVSRPYLRTPGVKKNVTEFGDGCFHRTDILLYAAVHKSKLDELPKAREVRQL